LWKARFTLFQKHYSRAWNVCAQLLVRAGLRRALRLAKQKAQRGEMTDAALQQQLAAYEAVIALSRAPLE